MTEISLGPEAIAEARAIFSIYGAKMAERHLVIFKWEENPYECPNTMVSLPGNSVGYHDVVV